MELKCPQCGKWMAVSHEELLMHDSQVVCPQCLAVCRYENGTLVVRDDSDAPYRHTATVVEPPRSTARFCHSCGKQLPDGIRFCPYCGADLEAPFGQSRRGDHQEKPASKTIEDTPRPKVKQENFASTAAEPTAASAQVEDKLRTIGYRYSGGSVRLEQRGEAPGTAFKIIAYLVIALLLALLVYIIAAGLSVETGL